MSDEPIIRLRDAGVRADGLWILRGLSCALVPGRILAVIGPNGAGKTTALAALAGAAALAEGARETAPGARVGYAPQRPARVDAPPMRVCDFMRLAEPDDPEDARAMLAEVGAQSLFDAPLATLSGGEEARVWMARAMMGRPAALILDEPAASMDVGARAQVYALIRKAAREHGQAVAFASHDMHLVMDGADEALCLHEGRLHCAGAPERAMATPEWKRLFGPAAEGLAAYRHAHQPHP